VSDMSDEEFYASLTDQDLADLKALEDSILADEERAIQETMEQVIGSAILYFTPSWVAKMNAALAEQDPNGVFGDLIGPMVQLVSDVTTQAGYDPFTGEPRND